MERSKFPYTARSSAKVIRHAVSIDERRAKFRQDLMYQSETQSRKKHHAHRHHYEQYYDGVGEMMHGLHEKYRHRPSLVVPEGPNTNTNGNHKPAASETEDRGRKSGGGGGGQTGKLNIPQPGDERGGMAAAPYRAHSRSKSRATRNTAETASDYSQIAPFGDGDDNDEDGEGYGSEDETTQDIDEVWFAGGHGDVGGGWPVERDRKSTSHVPLVWMVREAMKAGLAFDIEKVVAMGCSEALAALGDPDTSANDPRREKGPAAQPLAVPDIRIDASSPPESPYKEGSPPAPRTESHDTSPTATDTEDHQLSPFHEMMHKAHCARIHDSLSYDCGMSFVSVLSWKIMEYMPFRRMDLQSDGTWKPIRWPFPCGEVRDIPDNVRVHGSVIRRMEQDKSYRPGNLIVGGGGRGCRVAPESYGMGEWECVANPGDPIGEIWKKRG